MGRETDPTKDPEFQKVVQAFLHTAAQTKEKDGKEDFQTQEGYLTMRLLDAMLG